MNQDKRLLERIAHGDRTAFAALYDALAADVYRYLLIILGEKGAAEDVLQETFLAVWQQARHFRGDSRVKTWILGIARYKAYTRLNGRYEEQLDEQMANGLMGEDGFETFSRIWREMQIAQAVAQLPVHHREALELVFGFGLSYREAADVLGCPIGTVKSRVSYALKALRERLHYLRGAEIPAREEEA